jgi:hypothetical protein
MLLQDYIDTDDEIVDSGVELTPEVVAFTHLDGFRLLVTFENGERRIFDAEPFLNRSPMSQQLLSADYFHKAFCSDGTIEWPNGLNFCQDTFYCLGIPVAD